MEWLIDICQCVVRDLDKYGICVVDNFMGKERAESIHRSVVSMYHSGVFVEGETVGLKSSTSTAATTAASSGDGEMARNVRSDKITWVDGSENNCVHIAFLIAAVDTIIMNFMRFKKGAQLGSQLNIGGRTKVRYVYLLLHFLFLYLI
jgi:hypoxia-inducible factor (prolyl hydroxylase)